MEAERLYMGVGRIFDGVRTTITNGGAIGIESGRIAWVGAASEVPAAPAKWFDCGPNSTALPGLIDVHTHFTLLADGRPYEEMAAEPDELLAMAAARNASVHLRSGVTTARDNGARNQLAFVLRHAIDAGIVEGPRLLVSGPPVTPTNGHFHWCNGVADNESEIRRAIERLVAWGADHVKVMASGGGTAGTDPGRASYDVSELRTAVDAAHGFDRLTTAHCRATDSMERALDAGFDCMEHGEFVEHDGDMAFDEELAKRLVDTGIYLSPTLQAGWDAVIQLEGRREAGDFSPSDEKALRAARQEVEKRMDHVSRFLAMGHGPRIVCGTDAGPFDYSFGHMDYGMMLFVRAGMSPAEALASATRVAAAACGVADRAGSIAPGREADILVVEGDPVEDISAVGRPLVVLKAGKPVTPWPRDPTAHPQPSPKQSRP